MPHLIVEYTDNLKAEGDIPGLLRKANQALIAQGGVFKPGAVRSRAVELKDYCMADGAADYAFVHATLKIGAGRTSAEKAAACTALFEMMKAHFAELYARRYLALSLELYEFDEGGTYKHNNVHARFAKPAATP
ncbi:MAG: 5-carboxymethyl-2-hydroxymuconate Delta-isomerase [Steroidobacteraceae bacterium]